MHSLDSTGDDKQGLEKYIFPNEPVYFTPDVYDTLLTFCGDLGTSDISIQTNQEVFAEIHGKLHRVTRRKLTSQEVIDFCCYIYGPNASALISSGKDIDTHHIIKDGDKQLYRFRVNITACLVGGYQGLQATLRTIASRPPSLESMDVPDDIRNILQLPQGIFVVSGATGSGKSTLLASIIADFVQKEDSNLKILTYEAPIEYVYDDIPSPSCLVAQTEVPRYLPSFAAGIRNALRRKPGLILIGEARDQETIEAVINAALTGHPVYTTVHSNGVADTLRRMITIFPAAERDARLYDLIETTKLLIWQALVSKKDGTRVPIREYLILSEEVRDQLVDVSPDEVVTKIRELLPKYGQTAFIDAKNKYDQGIIDFSVLKRFKLLDEVKEGEE
jgi:defect in organelle trafficking protein DotB